MHSDINLSKYGVEFHFHPEAWGSNSSETSVHFCQAAGCIIPEE